MLQAAKIPDLITVHAGPPDSPALNYTVPFADYIKNVVSRAVSPLWPEHAIRAVIYAAQTYALRKILDRYYRGRGYDFDITGDADYDQLFEPDFCVFGNINRYVDEQCCIYIAMPGSLTPIELKVTRDGRGWAYRMACAEDAGALTAELACRHASKGRTAAEILREAFGDIELVSGRNSDPAQPERDCRPLSLGDRGREVSDLQRRLNLISTSFPGIPKINPADGFFGPSTEAAVRRFQRIFELPDDGMADCATRNHIKVVYDTIRRLLRYRELHPMPVMAEVEGQEEPFKTLTEGDTGEIVRFAQYLLNFASLYTRTVKPVEPNGVYGRETTESVVDFQRTFGLSPTGDIDSDTFNLLLSLREAAYVRLGDSAYIPEVVPFGGRELRLGSRGDDVVRLQNFLNCVADLYSDTIGRVRVTGVFNAETRDAVRAVQRIHGMPQTGTVKEQDWDIITALYNDCAAARFLLPGQYPGYLIERIRNREVGF
jgi:peptidoglycan hydrolase-like protein with peptidoglycan-binding domain